MSFSRNLRTIYSMRGPSFIAVKCRCDRIRGKVAVPQCHGLYTRTYIPSASTYRICWILAVFSIPDLLVPSSSAGSAIQASQGRLGPGQATTQNIDTLYFGKHANSSTNLAKAVRSKTGACDSNHLQHPLTIRFLQTLLQSSFFVPL
jgi:hypothetical protein